MLLAEAKKIMETPGYLVSFDWNDGHCLTTDHFPDPHKGEEGFQTVALADAMARKFARHTRGRAVNICVVRASDFTPVGTFRIPNR